MSCIAENRYIVSALADAAVVIYADDEQTALKQGFDELNNGVIDMFSLNKDSLQVDLIEEEEA